MKRGMILMLAMAVLGTSSPAHAQRQRQNPADRIMLPTGWIRWFQQELQIDDRTAEELNGKAARLDEQIKALEKEFLELAKTYFDAEQTRKLEQHLTREESQKKLQGPIGERLKRFPAMFRVWAPRLGCDETQMEQINAVIVQYVEQTKAVGRDENVQIELASQTYDQVFAMLTPEQQKLLNDVIAGKSPAPPRPKRYPGRQGTPPAGLENRP